MADASPDKASRRIITSILTALTRKSVGTLLRQSLTLLHTLPNGLQNLRPKLKTHAPTFVT